MVRTYIGVKDQTMEVRGAGHGVLYRKRCWVCSQHRSLVGGSLFTRLRLWRCAECTTQARGKS